MVQRVWGRASRCLSGLTPSQSTSAALTVLGGGDKALQAHFMKKPGKTHKMGLTEGMVTSREQESQSRRHVFTQWHPLVHTTRVGWWGRRLWNCFSGGWAREWLGKIWLSIRDVVSKIHHSLKVWKLNKKLRVLRKCLLKTATCAESGTSQTLSSKVDNLISILACETMF